MKIKLKLTQYSKGTSGSLEHWNKKRVIEVWATKNCIKDKMTILIYSGAYLRKFGKTENLS